MGRLAGKYTLITGGTSGIGLATAQEFIAEGAHVAITGRNPDTLAEAQRILGDNAWVIPTDAGDIAAQKALADTPNLLPVLKEAGVVDSGGKGLLTIYKGFKLSLDGEEIESYEELIPEQPMQESSNLDSFSGENIVYGYCTEFFIVHLSLFIENYFVTAYI